MDCLRSFNLNASGNINTSTFTGSSFYIDWVDTHNKMSGWSLEVNPGSGFTFNIQGFKNIDIYGFNGNLYFQSNAQNTLGNVQAVVTDFGLSGNIVGIPSPIGGSIGSITSPFSFQQNNSILITKSNPKIDYKDPIKSCTQINFNKIFATGMAPENGSFVDLSYIINISVFYKFDGE